MTITDLILFVLIRLCIPKVCWTANCDLLQDKTCEKWEIMNGHGCSKWDGYSGKYTLVVMCKRNFHLNYYPNQTCPIFETERRESDFNNIFQCVQDKTSTEATTPTKAMSKSVPVTSETLGGPVMYIVIAALGMVLIAICVIVGVCWKRNRTDSGAHQRQMSNPSVSTNNTNILYDTTIDTSHLTVADHNDDFNYAVVMDLEGRAENIDDNEYNILRKDEQKKPKVHKITSYDDNDLYSHTPRDICHAQSDSETYSHLTSDRLGLDCSEWKDATDNVYNKLSIDDQNTERNVKDSTCADPDYDHTFIRRDESATIENDTYAHVNDSLV